MMQHAGAVVLDAVAARSLVVGQPEDEPSLCKKQSSKGKGRVVLPMYSSREIMARTTKYQECHMKKYGST